MGKLLPYIVIVILISAAALTSWIFRLGYKPVLKTEFPVFGQGMLPAYREGDLMYYRTDFTPTDLKRGVLVVYKPQHSQSKTLKRIIAVARDTLRFTDGSVYLNGKLLDEPYLYEQKKTDPGMYKDGNQFTITDGTVFVLGDNRNHSYDSRNEGPVPLSSIAGIALQ